MFDTLPEPTEERVMTQRTDREMFGYARVSTEDQRLDAQIDALLKYGVHQDRILTDQASGKSLAGRPGFKLVMKAMRPGVALVVWKLDRLGRNLSELIQTADLLRQRDARLISLTENIDTETASGKLMFHMTDGVSKSTLYNNADDLRAAAALLDASEIDREVRSN